MHYYRPVCRVSLSLLTLAFSLLANEVTAQPAASTGRTPAVQAADLESPAATPVAAPVSDPEPRAIPDYDGRGDDPTTLGDVLIWIPRVILSPLYLVSEFVLRRPLGWLLSTAEREQWAATLFTLFQFGPNREIAVVPTALFDLGFRPSIGVYARWNDFIARNNKLRLHAATGGIDWGRLSLADRIESADGRRRLQIRGDYTHRPDGLFYGIGLDSDRHNTSRYTYSLTEFELSFEARIWRASAARTFARFRNMDISPGTCCGDPSIERRVKTGTLRGLNGEALPLPPGYEGYRIYTHGAELFLDTRKQRPEPGSGLRLGVHAQHATDVDRPLERRWLRYGAISEAFWDITDQNRVLRLGVNVQMISAIRGEVPFTELIDLSDTGPLKGFVPGRIIGQSAAAVTLEYDWPIWIWLDGTIHIAAGNAFGPRFTRFALDQARISAGIGIKAPMDRDHAFNFLVAAGTRPLREGGKIEAFRLMFGGSRAF